MKTELPEIIYRGTWQGLGAGGSYGKSLRGMPRVPFNLGVPFAEWMRHLLDLYKIDLTSDQK
jgi:hypothetical protein